MTCLVHLFRFCTWAQEPRHDEVGIKELAIIFGAAFFLYLYLHLSDKARSGNA